MRKRNRLPVLFLVILLALTILPISVSANSPAPSPWYTFVLSDYPQGTVYVDILIRLTESDPHYRELVTENIPNGFSADAEIICFCEDDFRSYTFHYRGARSIIKLDGNNSVTLFTSSTTLYSEETEAYDHMDDIEQRGEVRIAMLDAQGNILQISKPHSIRPSGLFSYSLGRFYYNAVRDELIVDTHSNMVAVIILTVIGLLGMIWTCVVERLVALAYDGIKNYTRLIVLTNVVSQFLMRAGQILLPWLLGRVGHPISYFLLVLVLEVVVYLCEYLFYHTKMVDVPWRKCLEYTIYANTASAVSGLLLMWIFIL